MEINMIVTQQLYYCLDQQQIIDHMLVKLRNFIKQPHFHQLGKFGLNDTHNYLNLQQIVSYYLALTPTKKSKFIEQLLSSINSNSWIWELKIYMVVHQLLLNTQSQELQEKLLMFQFKVSQFTTQQDIKQWIRNIITKQYHLYLTKLCLDIDLINTCQKKQIECNIQSELIPQINKSFKALNLMLEIMQSQINFCKMGRYYPEYLVILALFKRYLVDIKKYYQRIKVTISHILDNYTSFTNQQITHAFYFLGQALILSDRQYQFFYNRYFYEKMKMFEFPTFYQLDYQKHGKMIKHIKKRGLNLDFKHNIDQRGRSKNKKQNKYRGLRSKSSMNSLNKSFRTNQNTAETIQDHCKTVGDYICENKYQEQVYDL